MTPERIRRSNMMSNISIVMSLVTVSINVVLMCDAMGAQWAQDLIYWIALKLYQP